MRVTLAQITPKLNRSNLDDIVKVVKDFKSQSDLIVFPELSLNGYLLQDKLLEDAWNMDELDILQKLSDDVDIVVGGAIRVGDEFKNTALYFHRNKLLSSHYKVHLPNYGMFEEARYYSAGNEFESFMVEDMRVSMVVCEDLWHKDVHHDLIEQNPDIIIALVASPARGFNENSLDIEDRWYEIIKTLAKECCAKVIFVNRVGFEDGLGFWGGSCVVNEDSKFIDKLAKYKNIIKTVEI